MRCPKCGFISFDHLEQCLKCKKNIKAVSDTMHGTVFNVAAPCFLQVANRRDEESDNDASFVDNFETDDDFIDEDLEVLVDDAQDEVGIHAAADTGNESAGSGSKSLQDGDDSEDREIEIDLSQFEDTEDFAEIPADTKKAPRDQEVQAMILDIPEELSDLSDLAPPVGNGQSPKAAPIDIAKKNTAGEGIDDLDFDLGLGDLSAHLAAEADPAKETILALDEIDFSETLTKNRAKPTGRQSGADMDEDLNFDLDLGGLSIHKDL